MPWASQQAELALAVRSPPVVQMQRPGELDSVRRHLDPGSAAAASSLACGIATRSVQLACVSVSVAWEAAPELVPVLLRPGLVCSPEEVRRRLEWAESQLFQRLE